MSEYKNWNKYPFTVKGVNFISYVNPNGSFADRIAKLPIERLNEMNTGAILGFVGQVDTMTRSQILNKLDIANEGYQNAYLALAE